MRYRLLPFLACMLTLGSLVGDDAPQTETEVSPPLVNLTALPSAIVNGCVNVITGDFCEHGQDGVVSGVDPYVLGHSYISSYLGQADLGAGWSFLHHHTLNVYPEGMIKKGPGDDFPLQHCNERRFMFTESTEEYDDDDNSDTLPGNGLTVLDTETLKKLHQEFEIPPESEFEEFDVVDDSDTNDVVRNMFDTDELVEKGEGFRRGDAQRGGISHIVGYKDSFHKKPFYLTLYDPSGGHLLFKTKFDKYDKERCFRHFKLVTRKSGFTNVMGGKIGAHTNIKNISIRWDSKTRKFHVTHGDGTVYVYRPRKNKKGTTALFDGHELRCEKKPNGNLVVYDYNDKHELSSIRTKSSDKKHTINWVQFEQKSTGAFYKHPSLHVHTSDDLEHVYYFTKTRTSSKFKGKSRFSIKGIKQPGLAYTRFQYCPTSSQHKRRVISKTSEDGYFLNTSYYSLGKNYVGDRKVDPESSKDRKFLRNRVSMLREPVGPRNKEITTHRFFYHRYKSNAGFTTVYDALNNFTRYFWDRNKRLSLIQKFDKSGARLMSEKYLWGKAADEGRLVGRILFDEKKNPTLYHKFIYDNRGNIIEDVTYGQFKNNSCSLEFKDGKIKHTGCDKVVIASKYSNDRFNLKIEECDPNGNYTYYEYKNGTNLLKAKFLCEKDKIKRRQFFDYDSCANLIEEITDDGTSRDKDDLKHVTERHIKRIKPKMSFPHFGDPEEVEELYFDFDKNREVLLSKTVHTFTKKGLVKQKAITDQAGKNVLYEYKYDDVGRQIYSKDPLGYEVEYAYDKSGLLSYKRGPRKDLHWEYEYDAMGRLLKEIEKQDNGLTLETSYSYDTLGRKTSVTDPQNNTTYYEYDALNRVTCITYPPLYDHEGKKATPTKCYTYKNLGSIVIEQDENGHKTKTTYNALGKVISQRNADGTEHGFTYDLKGNLKKEVAPTGTISTMYYDAFDRLKISRIEKDGTLLSRKEVVYNSFHPIQEIGPCGEKIKYEYDNAGRKVACRQGKRRTVYSYDERGRLAKERTMLSKDAFIAKHYKYDDLDRIVYEKVRDNEHKVCSYQIYGYDAEGNRTTTIQNIADKLATTQTAFISHSLPEYSIDAHGFKTHYKYFYKHLNEYGQLVFRKDVVDARGCTDEETFDARGNLSKIQRFDPFGNIIAKKELFYDPANNLVRTHESAIIDGYEQKKIITLLTYGPNNRLESITQASGTPEEKVTRYTYNSYGQLETIIYADGTTLHHTYDSKGRLERYVASDHSIDYTYTYDAQDRVTCVQNGNGSKTIRRYNEFGEVVSEILESGLALEIGYDNAGRIKELLLPDKSKIGYDYSQAFLQSITRMDASGQETYRHTILERDLSGNIKSTSLLNKAGNVTYQRDLLGRCTIIQHPLFSQHVTQDGFDPLGNLLTLNTSDPQGTTNRSFAYDFLSQLTEEKGPQNNSYSYDSLYNRISHNDKQYKVNSLHAVLSDSENSFGYDPRGNRVSMSSDDKMVLYKYDALDRLISVSFPNKTRFDYSYDAFNRRIKKERYDYRNDSFTLAEVTNYLYVLDNEIGATDASGKIIELRLLGEGLGAEIGASIAIELNGTPYAPLPDRQGNVALLLDTNGQAVESYRYDAFGNETTNIRSPQNPWRFSSKRTDPETGLVNFGRRYYDPRLGKWLTQDPLGLKAGPNLYAYLLNCPLTHIDLYGLFTEELGESRVAYNATYGLGKQAHERLAYRRERDRQNLANASFELKEFKEQYFSGSPQEDVSHVQEARFWDRVVARTCEGFEALDQVSMAAMLVPIPTVRYSAMGWKVVSTGAKAMLRMLRTNAVTQTISPSVSNLIHLNPYLNRSATKIKSAAGTAFQSINKHEQRNLPKNPNELLIRGYKEITHPEAAKRGHRTFKNPVTDQEIRFDKGTPGMTGHRGFDHYHYTNPNGTGKIDFYVDINGNPCAYGSDKSHLYGEF